MASLVSTSTKYFLDTMAGAPVLNNASGSLIALLEAVLKTGFGIKAMTSMTIAGGVATINFTAPASAALPKSVIAVSGITGTYAALNSEQRVETVSTTSVTFLTDMPDGMATLSSASFRMAPLGWEEPFTAAGKAVFRPLDPMSTRPYLRILDSAASPATTFSARAHMYESMTDVDTGTNMAPPTVRLNGGTYWWKTNVASAAAQAWAVVGDSRGFYFIPVPHFSGSATLNGPAHWFGDIKPYRAGDSYCAALIAPVVEVTSSMPNAVSVSYNSASSGAGSFMRGFTGLGATVSAAWRGVGSGTTGASGADNNALGPFPNQSTNGLLLAEVVVGQSPLETYGPRGTFPGAAFVPQSNTGGGVFARGTLIDGVGSFAGSKLMCFPQGGTLSSASNDFAFFIDVTRDWRS